MSPLALVTWLSAFGALGLPGASSLVERLPAVVWIDGGSFVRGSDMADVAYASELCRGGLASEEARGRCAPERFRDEMPQDTIWVSAYGIDRVEVTVGAWGRCVRAGVCAPPRLPADDPRVSRLAHPVAGITWDEARRYCAFAGGRLPSEAEWERAARGPSTRRRFPWGRFFNPRLANHGGRRGLAGEDGHRHVAPVGSYPDGASPLGVLDMAGNVWEWTADRYDPEGHGALRVDPRGPESGGERSVRGGSWTSSDLSALRVTARQGAPEGASSIDLGVRCAYDARPRGTGRAARALTRRAAP